MIKKIIFFGTPLIAVHTLNMLAKEFEIVLVITEPDKPSGRGLTIKPTPVKEAALKLGLNIAQPKTKDELTNLVKGQKADLGVIIAYGKILTKEAIEAIPNGILNIHGSLLPKYRGPSPIQYAILAGDQKTGITIMKIDAGIDTGEIISQKEITISKTDTTATLATKLVEIGTKELISVIPKYISGEINSQPQQGLASQAPKIAKEMAKIDWSNKPEVIERQIRAFNPWPKAFTFFNNERLIIHQAVIKNNELIPQVVQVENKQKISWQDFLNGQRLSQKEALAIIQTKKT